MEQELVNRIVEAALLASSQPLTPVQLNGLFPLDEPAPEGAIDQALAELQATCVGRGIELVEVASGWRYQVKADVHPWVARLWTERQTKYTRATLETLALIAYRQPITRGEIEQVRGVATNSNIIKALEEREWIRVVGHRDVPGRPELLGTTKSFLDYFGLKRLDELPPLSELKDFGELEPELGLDQVPPAIKGIAGPDAAGDASHARTDATTDSIDTNAPGHAATTVPASTIGTDPDPGHDDDLDSGRLSEPGSDVSSAQHDDGDEPDAGPAAETAITTDTDDVPSTYTTDPAPADDGDGARSNT